MLLVHRRQDPNWLQSVLTRHLSPHGLPGEHWLSGLQKLHWAEKHWLFPAQIWPQPVALAEQKLSSLQTGHSTEQSATPLHGCPHRLWLPPHRPPMHDGHGPPPHSVSLTQRVRQELPPPTQVLEAEEQKGHAPNLEQSEFDPHAFPQPGFTPCSQKE